ncbi:NAD(P)H-hydrate dehydratase [Periweissella fabaria]|uniref:ADP-dependent (S)-NAD(P)H-hydrate dehydratase n=1 Tax=Periweissella fabaria TaxID=546157 RepID=A0ABN8BL82_9LACO|nr:NAD(P)H-hydrate dehydratase [Periweissella fabaria]MCM0597923.1 NAD(P)H-hydrate dehydratase [Periweissella fabaria]CAH0417376.1 ADP-dependent (S)-NAD(P)H-hydrate dehydratase [Periweissella fabaria]
MNIIDQNLVAKVITPRPIDSYKGTYGRIMLIGGFEHYHGAIILASKAAVYGGSGLVTVVTAPETITALNTELPEAMALSYHDSYQDFIATQDVIVIGPGLGTSLHALTILKEILTSISPNQTLIVDGSALTLLARHQLQLPTTKLTVLTPHQMEWQRVSGLKIINQTPTNNQVIVDQLQAIVIVKKHHSELYTPHAPAQKIIVGGPYQATGGMGDTLAGLVGSFLGQFKPNATTVAAALYLHSAIADELAQQQYVVLPSQISAQLPLFMARFAQQ